MNVSCFFWHIQKVFTYLIVTVSSIINGLRQTVTLDDSLGSSRRDDFNEGHIIVFGWEMRKLSWKPFCSLFLNCSPEMDYYFTAGSSGRTPRQRLWHLGDHWKTTRSQVHMGHPAQRQPWVERQIQTQVSLRQTLHETFRTGGCEARILWADWLRETEVMPEVL